MTSIKNKIENISENISNINDILNSFIDYDKIPKIDIDILKSKLRIIYEDVDSINSNSEIQEDILISKKDSIKVEDEKIEEKNIVKEIESEIEDVIDEIETKDDENLDENIEEENFSTEPIQIEDDLDEANHNIVEDSVVEIIDIKNDADLSDGSEVKEILEEFEKANDLASKLQFNHIEDINNAVSINDKIGFINDIFGGDSDSYSACVDKLNKASDLNNAINILNVYNNWSKTNSVHKKFVELVFRKFV